MTKREIIGFIASRYGIVIDEDDPVFAVIAVQIALMEDYERRLQKIESGLAGKDPTTILENGLEEVQKDVKGLILNSENNMRLLIENGVQWTSDPTTKAQWWFAASFCCLLLFGLGFIIGTVR